MGAELGMTDDEFAVLDTMLNNRKEGIVRVRVPKIAQLTSLSYKRVRQAQDGLMKRGIIIKVGRNWEIDDNLL